MSKLVRTGTAASPVYERTVYMDGIFEYVILETGSTTYEKNYIHIMDDQSRIAELRINAGAAFPGDIADDVVYNLEDQIGSSSVRLDLNGTVIDREEYYPFGDSSLRTFTYKRYRYVGKERDAESGLYYYGARYYAAWTCRFISVDPLAAKYPYLTPYNYAGNKPIGDIDIDGMQSTGDQPVTPQSDSAFNDAAKQAVDYCSGKEGYTVVINTNMINGKFVSGQIIVSGDGKTLTGNYTPGSGFVYSGDGTPFNPTGGGLKSTYNSELRTKYHENIKNNANKNLTLLKEANTLEAEEAILDKAINERNAEKIRVRGKLTPDATEVTTRLENDSKYTKTKLREAYGPGGEKKTNLTGRKLTERIVKASGKSNPSLSRWTPYTRALGWTLFGLGIILSAIRIYQDPTPETIGEEIGATIGGIVLSIVAATVAVALLPVAAVAGVVLAVSFLAGAIGGYLGSQAGGIVGKKAGGLIGKKSETFVF